MVRPQACREPTAIDEIESRASTCTAPDADTADRAPMAGAIPVTGRVARFETGLVCVVGVTVVVSVWVVVTEPITIGDGVAGIVGVVDPVIAMVAVSEIGGVGVAVSGTAIMAVPVGETGATDGAANDGAVVTAGTGGVAGGAMATAVPVGGASEAIVGAAPVVVVPRTGVDVWLGGSAVDAVTVAPTSCSAGAPSGAAWADGVPSGGVMSTPCATNASATDTRLTMPAYRLVRVRHARMNLPPAVQTHAGRLASIRGLPIHMIVMRTRSVKLILSRTLK